MPREIARKPRFIYPTIATSLSIAQISALAELLFWRILPQADDQGRLSGHPKRLKALACPMRDEITQDNIPELLKELEEADLVTQYSSSSEPVIQIKAWWDYQSGMRRIYPSKYPAPEGWQDRVKGIAGAETPTTDRQAPTGDGQAATNAPNVPPEPEPESGNQVISKPEPEPEEGSPPTAAERGILKFLKGLKNWRFGQGEDLTWLRDFQGEFPAFDLSEARACWDYHSGRAPPKHKGIWKNRFRNWITNKQEFEKGGKGEQVRNQRVKGARRASDFRGGKW